MMLSRQKTFLIGGLFLIGAGEILYACREVESPRNSGWSLEHRPVSSVERSELFTPDTYISSGQEDHKSGVVSDSAPPPSPTGVPLSEVPGSPVGPLDLRHVLSFPGAEAVGASRAGKNRTCVRPMLARNEPTISRVIPAQEMIRQQALAGAVAD